MARVIIFPVINDQRSSIQLATQIVRQGSNYHCTVCSKLESVSPVTLPLRFSTKTALHGRFRRLADSAYAQIWNQHVTDYQAPLRTQELCRCPIAQPQVSAEILTTKETELIKAIYMGYSSKDIALEWGRSNRTVEKHRENVTRKLGGLLSPHCLTITVLAIKNCELLNQKFNPNETIETNRDPSTNSDYQMNS